MKSLNQQVNHFFIKFFSFDIIIYFTQLTIRDVVLYDKSLVYTVNKYN